MAAVAAEIHLWLSSAKGLDYIPALIRVGYVVEFQVCLCRISADTERISAELCLII